MGYKCLQLLHKLFCGVQITKKFTSAQSYQLKFSGLCLSCQAINQDNITTDDTLFDITTDDTLNNIITEVH